MTLMQRRRALMTRRKEADKTPIMPSCLNWYYVGTNSKALSDDSYQLGITSGWKSYSYATRSLSLKYSDLVGKTIVIEYDVDKANTWVSNTAYIALANSPNYNAGNSGLKDRTSYSSTSGNPTHYYREITIGTSYVSTYTGYYLTVGAFAYSSTVSGIVKVANFRCYLKGE